MWINTYSNLKLYFNNQFVSKGTITHCITASLTLSHNDVHLGTQSVYACAGGKQCFSIIFTQTPGGPAVVVVPIASDIIWSQPKSSKLHSLKSNHRHTTLSMQIKN